ncbi:NAD(P)/FAD-dependent oxidoreductase [Kocuria sp. 2SI]|uniref:FAD-dependent oxidoreductase n=1 Tax=Kocuria sp. 2SI TaxID=2502203 RepID=UPI0010F47D7D|nr:NAD(P)/FAD-dependent oxidoreductase [Kocuria sp. 2SI]
MSQQAKLHSDVLIVGGGTASLFLSRYLLNHPRQPTVQVIERAASDQRRAQGVLVHPITQSLIEDLLPDHSWGWSGTVQRLREFHGQTLLYELDAGTTGKDAQRRYPSNEQLGDIDRVLLKDIGGHPRGQIRYQAEVTSIDLTEDVWHVDLATPEGPQQHTSSVLVAADGRESTLRDWLGVPYERVDFPGKVDVLAFPDRRDDVPAISMVLGAGGATTVVDNGVGPNTLIFDMRADRTQPQTPSALRDEAVDRAATAGLSISNPAGPLFTTSFRSATVACGTWLARRALVFGDAAHAMHNLGGQGFNLTVQDAVALAPGIIDLIDGDDSRLRAYETFRLPYITEVQRRQNKLFDAFADDRPDDVGEGWFQPLHRSLVDGQDGLDFFLDGAVEQRDA